MRKVPYPNEYKEHVIGNIGNKFLRHFDVRVKFNNNELSVKDIGSIKISSDLFSGDTFTIGSTVTETIDLMLFTDTVFKGNTGDVAINKSIPVIPYISLETEVEKEDHSIEIVWQEVCMGMFYINPDGVSRDGIHQVSVRASSMFNHAEYGSRVYEEDYYENNEEAMFSKSLIDIVTEICDDLGLVVATAENTSFPDIMIEDKIVEEEVDTGTGDTGDTDGGDTGTDDTDSGCHESTGSSGAGDTDGETGETEDETNKSVVRNCLVGKSYKEIVEYAALLYGGYARVVYKEDTDGAEKATLEFFKMVETNYLYDESNSMSFKIGDESLRVSKLECIVDDETTLTAGGDTSEKGDSTVFLSCPDMTQERLNTIFSEYSGFTYFPITSKIFGSPTLEVGDRVKLKEPKNGREREMPLQSITYNMTGNGLTMDIRSICTKNSMSRNRTVKESLDDLNNKMDNMEQEIEDVKLCNCDCEERLTALEGRKECTCDPSEIEDLKERIEILEEGGDDGDDGDSEGLGGNPITFYSDPSDDNYNTLYDGSNHVGSVGSHFSGSKGELYISSNYPYDVVIGAETGSGSSAGSNKYEFPFIVSGDFHNRDGNYYHKGVNMINPHLLGTVNIRPGSSEDAYGTLSTTDNNGLNVLGTNALYLGVGSTTFLACVRDGSNCVELRNNTDFYTNGGTIFMDGGTIGDAYSDWLAYRAKLLNCKLDSNLNGNGYTVTNTNTVNTTEAQSEYTSGLIENGTNENMIYNNMSYDSGELRWCWKENVFTYAEADIDPVTDEWVYTGRYLCYVELPIFMAENIQNDYHINISKMSWGDYRIIEKNPYYFILESQEEDFAFTFEVVAKLNDNQTLNNNAIIANIGIESSTEEPIIIEEEEN